MGLVRNPLPIDSPAGRFSPGRKVRSSDCRVCGIWRSLVDGGLPLPAVQAICERMWLHTARKKQVLYLEGNRARHLYVVRQGTVKLLNTDISGREHVTAILERGELFGFEAAFHSVYTTSAEAHSDSELCLLSASDLADLMQSVPSFSLDIARFLHHRLISARQRLAFLGNPGARARLAGYLQWRMAAATDRPRQVPNELTLRELGGILGLAPETVCRTLRSLHREGVIEVGAGQIQVRDCERLGQLAAG